MALCFCGAHATELCPKCGAQCFCAACAACGAGTGPREARAAHQAQCRRTRREAKNRVQGLVFGSLLLQLCGFCRRLGRFPAWQRFFLWCAAWLMLLELLTSLRFEMWQSGKVGWLLPEKVPEEMLASSFLATRNSATRAPEAQEVLATLPPVRGGDAAKTSTPEAKEVLATSPLPVGNDDAATTSAPIGQQEVLATSLLPVRSDDAATNSAPIVQQDTLAAVAAVDTVAGQDLSQLAWPDVKAVGRCLHPTNKSIDACCDSAVARLHRTAELRPGLLRSPRSADSLRPWWANLAPPVAAWYRQKGADAARGRPWAGTAVLLIGQVRDGMRSHVVENLRRLVFQELGTDYHIFAVLEYTRYGFSWRGKRNYTRDYSHQQVQQLLQQYTGNYTLVEWTEADKKSEKAILFNQSCTNAHWGGYGMAQQYLKLHRAFRLMELHEQKRRQRFALVLKLRPDVTYTTGFGSMVQKRMADALALVNITVPSVCGSIGGGGGDAVLVADRAAATALRATWKLLRGCQVAADACMSARAMHSACVGTTTLGQGEMLKETCGHGWVSAVLRYGLPNSHCGISGMLGMPRNLPELPKARRSILTRQGPRTAFQLQNLPSAGGREKAVRQRSTCRAFLSRPVAREVLEDLLDQAQRAPSGGNTQPWHLYVATGAALGSLQRAALAQLQKGSSAGQEYRTYPSKTEVPEDVHQAYMDRRIRVAQDLWARMGVERSDRAGRARALMENFGFWGAPVGVIVTVDRGADKNAWGHTGMLLQTLALLAVERGLATAMLEAWGNLGSCVYEALGIEQTREAVWCGVALGYPDLGSPFCAVPTQRRPMRQAARFLEEAESKL
ncbi:unnamed protein product [Effrenium voratum]|nr:unnamed protein product [Effrenium voratum]